MTMLSFSSWDVEIADHLLQTIATHLYQKAAHQDQFQHLQLGSVDAAKISIDNARPHLVHISG